MNHQRHRGFGILAAVATLIVASIFIYRIRPLVGITVGSGAIVLAALADLGVLAAVLGPFIAWRRRTRR
jgi:hypothetical protein